MTNEELVKLIKSGINQRDNMQRLYTQNIGFIRSVAKRYSYICRVRDPYHEAPIIEFGELMNEAFIGLCNAVKGYDESMGCTFLTYAESWIRQAIKRFLDNCGNTIRIPVWLIDRIHHYNRIQSHFMSKYGRKATTEEVADIMYTSLKTIEKLELYISRSSEPMSLDAPLTADEDQGLTIADSVADTSVNVEDTVIEEVVNEEVTRVWDEVSRVLKNPTMKDIILYRYRDNMTLKEIGDMLGMTSESVRHYENKGLQRLRSNTKTKRLFAMIA
jgi:RNA polymerase primary sigma factor